MGTIRHESMGCNFYKTARMTCMHLHQKLTITFVVFKLSKLTFRAHNLLDGLLKGANIMHNR